MHNAPVADRRGGVLAALRPTAGTDRPAVLRGQERIVVQDHRGELEGTGLQSGTRYRVGN